MQSKDQAVIQKTIKALQKKPQDHVSQRSIIQRQLKTLNSNGVLDFKMFSLSEKEGKILVDQAEINKILLNIEKTKYGENYHQESSKITLNDFKKRMSIINPNFPISDLNVLFQGKSELTSKELFDLLKDNEINNFDPVNETINMLCDDKDQLDLPKINTLMTQLGYGKLDKQDMSILTEILDVNTDQKVDKNDLKEIFNFVVNKQKLQNLQQHH